MTSDFAAVVGSAGSIDWHDESGRSGDGQRFQRMFEKCGISRDEKTILQE